ncbi:helix-turn-helix domain-containing protein [Vibrio ponticus]|uniref:Helix-turn-helix domain-containing protein n=1 Tax=Vibrio ponticus TaxID=265668 RepID=A0A3N3E1I4_9VIBR|nr:helix-turn-helix domain-containing protein [Vibrio ponticus]ROV60597.1 helix-turn-helix domain-containing protein [Vibrio ponticus]
MDKERVKVVILETEHVMESAAAGISDILAVANYVLDAPLFMVTKVNCSELPIESMPDVVFIPPRKIGADIHYDPTLLTTLKQWHGQGCTVAANCASVFWLGYAGLLENRAATTHWKLCDQLASEFPAMADVKRYEMVVDEGSVVTGSGLFAFQDLALHLIARYAGFDLAKEVADICLLDFSGRLQAYYERFLPDLSHGNALVLKAQQYCHHTPLDEQNNKAMAEVCCVSEKTLTRAFKKVLNLTPQQYRLNYKMDVAKREMNINKSTVEQVAFLLGYNDVSNFTRVFKKVVGITPTHYRSRFATD